MKTITVELYTFNELPDEVKKVLIDKCNDEGSALPNDWYQDTINEWHTKLIELGFLNPHINFSGFYSQGDGASFDADINIVKFINQESAAEKVVCENILLDEIPNFTIRKNKFANHYCHENTRTVSHPHDDIDATINNLKNRIETIRFEKCKEIYLELESEYESYFTTEAAIEYLSDLDIYYCFKSKFNLDNLDNSTIKILD